jgi:hypothetical protein
MDQRLLDALNNLSLALEELNESLDKSKSGEAKTDVGTTLQSGDFGNTLKEISVGIKSIKDDTKKILDNQQTLIKMQKEQSSTETKVFEEAGGGKTKQMIKDGVTVIGLIAGAVLAIGLAFKIIGNVDFVSVIALSLSLPLIAKAFAMVSQIENLDIGTVGLVSFALVTMSLGLMLSSHILSAVAPVGFLQLITVIGISAAFGAASLGLGKLINSIGKMNPAMAIAASFLMPIVLVAFSYAVMLSSNILNQVQPIGLAQALTTILISVAFGAATFGLGKLVEGLGKLNPAMAINAALIMPIVLVALSASIVASSYLLSQVQPVGFTQALTAIFISAMFVVLSYSVKPLLQGVKDVNYEDILKGGLVILGLVTAVSLASGIINTLYSPVSIGTTFNMVLFSIGVMVSTLTLGLAVKGLTMLGITNPATLLKGAFAIVILAGVIALSSHVLGMGSYGNYPSLDWALGVSLSLLSFGIGVAALGLIVMSGIGAVALVAGAAAIVGVAGTIVLVSEILSKGVYENFPSLDWAQGVGTSLLMFASAIVVLGVINSVGGLAETLTFGAVDNPIESGISAILMIASSMVLVANILSSGDYSNYPDLSWSLGVGTSLMAFASQMMFFSMISPFVVPGIFVVNMLVSTISHIDNIFSTGDFNTYPGEDWITSSVSILGKFANLSYRLSDMLLPIILGNIVLLDISRLVSNVDILFSKGNWEIFPKDEWTESTILLFGEYAKLSVMLGILAIPISIGNIITLGMASMISIIDFIFSKGNWETYPNNEWVDSTIFGLVSYAKLSTFLTMSAGSIIFGSFIGNLLAYSILNIDKIFSQGNWDSLPERKWIEDLEYVFVRFSNLMNTDFDLGFLGFGLFTGTYKLEKMANTILDIDKIFSQGNFNNFPTKNWVDGIFESLLSLNKWLSKMSDDDLDMKSGILDKSSVSLMVGNITSLAMGFDMLSNSISKFSQSVNGINLENIEAIKSMTSNVILLSLMDPDMFEEVMEKLEEKGGVFGDLINNFEKQKKSGGISIGSAVSGGSPKSDPNLTQLQEMNKKLDTMTAVLSNISNVVSGDLRTYLLENQNNSQNIQTTSRSDKRLKNIIRKVGVSELGINIYEFTYKFNNQQIYQGVIAQELIGTEFESSLVSDKNGYYSVDYSKLDVEFKKLNKIK